MILENLSYRYKVPMLLSATILITGIVISAVLVWRTAGDLKADLYRNAIEVGSVLSRTLPAAIKHDDLWLAYQIINAAKVEKAKYPRLLIVLDKNHKVYVSGEPGHFPILSYLRDFGVELAGVEKTIITNPSLQSYQIDQPGNAAIYAVLPMLDDGIAVGTLIIGYPRAMLLPRYLDMGWRITYSALLVLAILLPIGWYIGKISVQPLIHLARCLGEVGRVAPQEVDCDLVESKDEFGQLGVSFRQMLRELQEKQRLENKVFSSERLAAVGRLAAGVAHEINNPLGGMLNAINTLRRHGHMDSLTGKTLRLQERGLHQIKDTVSALLVEVNSDIRELSPSDIDDVHTLLQTQVRKKAIQLDWQSNLEQTVPLPSTPVRQVLLNLSLNAITAARRRCNVQCLLDRQNDLFSIVVVNDGREIQADQITRLFEPFVYFSENGNGLGLWVTYQLIQQLKGEIDVSSDDQETAFRVQLPLRVAA